MKHWILTIFRLSSRMDKLCVRVDRQIDRLAVNLTLDTTKLINAILILQDRKVRFINFRVLYSRMKAALSPAERALAVRYANGESLLEIALSLGISHSTVARRLRKIVEVCGAVLRDLKFDEKRLLKDYRDIPLIYNTVKEFERCDGHLPEASAFCKSGASTNYFDGITL